MNPNSNQKSRNGRPKSTTTITTTSTQSSRKAPGPKKDRSRSLNKGPHTAIESVRRSLPRAGSAKISRSTQRLLASMALPRETECVRIGNNYGSDKTAVAKLFRKTNVRPATLPGLAGDIPIDNVVAFAFRDPLRSFVYSFGLSATDQYRYSNNFSFSAAGEKNIYPNFEGPLNLDTSYSNCKPHGDQLFLCRLGLSDQNRGFFCSVGDYINITIAARPGALQSYRIGVKKLTGAQWAEIDTVALSISQVAGGTVQVLVIETGYYCFDIFVEENGGLPTATVVGTLALPHLPNTDRMCWGQLSLPKIEENLDAPISSRITSVSLMLTNTASPLNRQGQVTGLQIPKRTLWTDYIDYEDIASSNKATTFNVVNGMYGFLKPTDDEDLRMETFRYATDDTDDEYVFDVLPKSDYLTIQAQITDSAGRQGYFTPCHHIEFSTLSQWFSTETSALRPEELETSLRLLSRMPQWHENDFHISDIWNGIKSFVSDVWSGIKEVGSAVAPYAPLIAPLLL